MSPASYRAAPPRVGEAPLYQPVPGGRARGRRALPPRSAGRGSPAPARRPARPGTRRRRSAGPPAPGPGRRSRRCAARSARASRAALDVGDRLVQRRVATAPPPSGRRDVGRRRRTATCGVGVVAAGASGLAAVGGRLPGPGAEHLVQRLLEGVGVADPVAVVDQHLLQQREGVLAGALRRTAARRRAGRSPPIGSVSRLPNTGCGVLAVEQRQVRADLVVRVERLLHLLRPAERRVARQSQDLDLAVGLRVAGRGDERRQVVPVERVQRAGQLEASPRRPPAAGPGCSTAAGPPRCPASGRSGTCQRSFWL